MAQIQVTLVRSLIGRPGDQRATVRALGLTRMHSSVIHDDSPSIRGMVRKVRHLVRVEAGEVEEPVAAAAAATDVVPESDAGGEEETE